jgi:hypothetical protein
MKKALTVSIVLNLVLAVCLLSSPKRRNSDPAPPASDVPQADPPGAQVEAVSEQSLPAAESSQVTQVPVQRRANRSKEQPVLMPLVFQNVNLTQLNLNAGQLQAIDDLRQKFLDEIGGLDQEPNDPGYCERWIKSQPEVDNDLRGMIGVAAFQNFQVEAVAP